jgi:hypothetical protein
VKVAEEFAAEVKLESFVAKRWSFSPSSMLLVGNRCAWR